jgi:catechol 2,3-dioxygenase-like lactoylglutathione lyase family enzyme
MAEFVPGKGLTAGSGARAGPCRSRGGAEIFRIIVEVVMPAQAGVQRSSEANPDSGGGMSGTPRVATTDAFQLRVPVGWEMEPDEEGGVMLSTEDGAGLLHLSWYEQDGEPPDPGEELFVFLDEQGVELEEDDLEDVDLGGEGEAAYCEYLAAGEDDQESDTYWLLGVATWPGVLVFANYSCPAAEHEREREIVADIIRSLRPRAGNGYDVGLPPDDAGLSLPDEKPDARDGTAGPTFQSMSNGETEKG